MAMDFSKNRFFFAAGTKVKVRDTFGAVCGLDEKKVYKVVKESHLPDEENGNDLEVVIYDGEGHNHQTFAHYFRGLTLREQLAGEGN